MVMTIPTTPAWPCAARSSVMRTSTAPARPPQTSPPTSRNAEIKEVLLQTAIYCGVPDANTAFRIAAGVLAEDAPH